jgi:glycosyltransferase involved in cell wall biosynthesis
MSTLIVAATYLNDYDGVADYSKVLYQQMKKKGVEVAVLTKNVSTVKDKHDHSTDIFTLISDWGLTDWIAVIRLINKREIRSILVQYVPYSFSRSGMPVKFVLLMAFLRLYGIRIHTNFHEVAVRFKKAGLLQKFRAVVQKTLAYWLCFSSKTIQTSNQFYASLLRPFKITVIPVPSNFEFHLVGNQNLKVSKSGTLHLAINANRCNDYFFKALDIYKKNCKSEFQVWVLGRAYSDDIIYIKEKASYYKLESNLLFMLNLRTEDYLQALKNATIFIQLENVEYNNAGGVSSKSGTTATAMQLGLPVISTKGDMTDDTYFKDEFNISFVLQDDPHSLVSKIQSLEQNRQTRISMGQQAQHYYWKFFSWDHTLNHYLALIS